MVFHGFVLVTSYRFCQLKPELKIRYTILSHLCAYVISGILLDLPKQLSLCNSTLLVLEMAYSVEICSAPLCAVVTATEINLAGGKIRALI